LADEMILLAHGDAEILQDLVPRLSDAGYEVIGPARTAATALTWAGHAPLRLALIGERLAGRRNGRDLGRALRDAWGMHCLYLRDGAERKLPSDTAA
jgi:hypothetical protein